ncbi:MAG TPA: dipeptide ABC transporter ATP-binding protein [Rhizomicrobium sp.]|nr:dipeptide ABC transporter ATP-binding protein [Rhizomicrobium sp.]
MSGPILQIRNLDVRFTTPDGEVHAVKRANIDIAEGECLGVVGESGSGKSQLFLGALGLLANNGRAAGSVKFCGEELLGLPQSQINRIRGSRITMIFQDPLTSLTPHLTIGAQIIESLRVHQHLPYAEALRRSLEILDLVRIPEARERMSQFPHELSGGMRQRVMIAMATACGPDLLVADEPTTALDVTVQAQILDIMRDLKKELKTAIAMVSHDMGVIAGIADNVAVMRDGEVVETGSVDEVFYHCRHPYTRTLLDSIPRVDRPLPLATEPSASELLKVENLRVYFPVTMRGSLFGKKKQLRAVDDVSFTLRQGETLGVVGESGCGKSTLARAILRLAAPTDGVVAWYGRNLAALSEAEVRPFREQFQIVFQDPLASLDPRMTIGQSIAEPLKSLRPDMLREDVTQEVRSIMARVGLEPAWINRYPHEISGGQNQRVGIARAMILKPKLLICDEAVSALDVSIQSQIVELIRNLQSDFGLSLIFISHDLSVVRQVSHRVMVLYLGRIVELADRDTIYNDARHPYTRALIDAIPIPDPRLEREKVRLPLPIDLPSPLDTRAPLAFLRSKIIDDPNAEQYRPALIEVAPGHLVAEHDFA